MEFLGGQEAVHDERRGEKSKGARDFSRLATRFRRAVIIERRSPATRVGAP